MTASMWRDLDRPVPAPGTSGEQVARAAAAQIYTNLEEQCELQEALWEARDQDWALNMGLSYRSTRINRVQKGSIYLGAQPSLVTGANARFDKWPAITVRVGTRNASMDLEQPDQYDSMDLQLIIEVLANAGPFSVDPVDDRDSSDAMDRQYQRLTDAVLACINADRTLGSNVLPIKRPPTMTPSLPFVMPVDPLGTSTASRWMLYQGMELVWTVTSLVY